MRPRLRAIRAGIPALAPSMPVTVPLSKAPARPAESPRPSHWHRREEAIMGTAIVAELRAADAALGRRALDAVMTEMHRIDAAMSPHKPDSELTRINREAADRAVPVTQEMFGLLRRALDFSARSGGAFDITYAAAGHLYDYRAGIAPDEAALAGACALVGWQGLHLDEAAGAVRFARPGMRIDLGGFAKGHAVDNAIAILRRLGISHAMVSAGGDSHVIGNRDGRPWTIAIRDPRRQEGIVAVLPLEDVAISTSGDYERYFERGGVRHHHLLDPRTGRSPAGIRSVTVIAADGLTTEALSKTVFVQGVEPGLALVESQPGADAVIVDAEGRLHYSAGFLG
jgi:thiamine biosynthesis lipoprotein